MKAKSTLPAEIPKSVSSPSLAIPRCIVAAAKCTIIHPLDPSMSNAHALLFALIVCITIAIFNDWMGTPPQSAKQQPSSSLIFHKQAPTAPMPSANLSDSCSSVTLLFGAAPQQHKTPLEPNNHPELDLSPELDDDGIQKHQSLIGSLQWAVSLGRLDITTAVMLIWRIQLLCRTVEELEMDDPCDADVQAQISGKTPCPLVSCC